MSKTIDKTSRQMNGVIRSKHRLAEISHHFLSDENQRLPAWENTTVIPVLLGSKTDDYVVYELNRAFNRQNSSSMVLNIENRLTASGGLTDRTATSSGDEETCLPDYCLIPASSPSTMLALQSDRIIIAVHASLSGVRIAYDQLAFMASLDTDFNVCAIMLDAKTTREAKRFFEFLYENAQSLLALELECGGYLVQKKIHTEETNIDDAEIEECDFATTLDGVADGLLRKYMPSTKQHLSATTRLAAPTTPAALLS